MADQDAKSNQETEESVTVSQVDLSAISYSADAIGDTQEESALFRQLESSTVNESALNYSEDDVNDALSEELLLISVKDGEALGIVVAPVEAPVAARSGCHGLKVLTCKSGSRNFKPQDIIVAVNELSIMKMTGENALTVIKMATDRKIKVLRKKASAEIKDKENVSNDVEVDDEEEAGGSIHSNWKRFKRRYAKRINDNNRKPSIYIAGSEVKVDRDRVCAPTMEPFKNYVPGGRRCENKEVYAGVLADMTRRSKKRSLSP